MQLFILLTHPRSGSTVLSIALRSLHRVYMGGEFFNDSLEYRTSDGRAPDGSYYVDSDCGDAFVRRSFIRPLRGRRFIAAGFKIFLNQAREPGANSVWKLLERERGFKIIRLYRRNLFAAYVSLKAAFLTDVWALSASSAEPASGADPFEVDPLQCEEFFTFTTDLMEQANRAFADHDVLDLVYEDHVQNDINCAVDNICQFLGCAAKDIEPMLKKQSTRALSEQVSNYEEVKRYFRDSRYCRWFEVP